MTTTAPSTVSPGPADPDAGPPGSPPLDAGPVSLSPRQVARRSVGWIALGLVALLVAAIGLLATSGPGSDIPLDSANPAPAGAKAVVEVLRQQGVDVIPASTLDSVGAAASRDSTVLVFDPNGYLDSTGFSDLRSLASTLVVVEPDFAALQALLPSVHAAGAATKSGPLAAACTVPAATRAGSIEPTAKSPTLRVTGDASDTRPVGCFPTGSDTYALVSSSGNGSTVHLLGSGSVVDNEGVVRQGNAALALNLLGEHHTLIWYLPSLRDVSATGPPDLGALTPGWVTPLMLLLIVVFVAAAIWRGRRFGPLVVENLPVVVRSGETMEGRARLYQRSSARLRAIDSLRIGAISRIAAAIGLPSTADTGEVSDAVAALTASDRAAVRATLVDVRPRTDAELVALSDRLEQLETAVQNAVNPENQRQTGRMDP